MPCLACGDWWNAKYIGQFGWDDRGRLLRSLNKVEPGAVPAGRFPRNSVFIEPRNRWQFRIILGAWKSRDPPERRLCLVWRQGLGDACSTR